MIEEYKIIYGLYDTTVAVSPSLMMSRVSCTNVTVIMYKLQKMYSSQV